MAMTRGNMQQVLMDQAVAAESFQVKEGGPPFDRLGERQLDVRPVHQAVCDDVLQRSWPPEQVQQRLVPAVDHCGEPVQGLEEGPPVVEHAGVVGRPVPASVHVAEPVDRRDEVVEAAGEVAVVGAERREVDVPEEQESVGLDE